MKIVVIDGYTMNPGDLNWTPITQLGDCSIYEASSEEEIMPRLADAQIVISNKVGFSRERMQQLAHLKYIGLSATGYNVIDCDAAKEFGIAVTNVPAYSTASVAQHVFALLLHFFSRVDEHDKNVRTEWPASRDFAYWRAPLEECAGQTFGIIGMGQIGRKVAEIAKAFGMKVIFYMHRTLENPPEGCTQVEMQTLLAESDVLSLHCPLNAQTEEIIDADKLSKMKKNAILINTGRGQLLDEQAVADALNQGIIAGAGMDVLSSEPPTPDNPLLHAKNCVITPHLAWATKESRQRLLDTVASNIAAFLDGKSQNRVA